MNLDIFNYIETTLEIYEEKREAYRLTAEEITEYFNNTIAAGSGGELSVYYRIKSRESTREKIIRNNLARLYEKPEQILKNLQDLIGVRIECMFIQDEAKVYKKLQSIFTKTEDGIYYFDPFLPKIRLNLAEHQPAKQKNGFDIYKIDGVYLMGREGVLFELQIKAMVNNFWGEIEHKIVYKNSAYILADRYVSDLMTSVKGSLNTIDSQLAVLYNQFKHTDDKEENTVYSQMSLFLSKMVHDTFADLMRSQIGFIINFRESCDTLVDYILKKNRDEQDYENYSYAMLQILHILKEVKSEELLLDEKFNLRGTLETVDPFVTSVSNTCINISDVDFNWHLFCLILFKLDTGENSIRKIENFVEYYKERVLSCSSFDALSQLGEDTAKEIETDILLTLAQIIDEKKNVRFLCENGIKQIDRMLSSFVLLILDNIGNGGSWDKIKDSFLHELVENIE